jgi:hypothetical protein
MRFQPTEPPFTHQACGGDCGVFDFSKGKMAILNPDALSKIAEDH